MSGPRDAVERFGVPVNYENGRPLTPAQQQRLDELNDAATAMLDVVHDCEGSARDDGWDFRSHRMRRASDWLELCLMMGQKVALENP